MMAGCSIRTRSSAVASVGVVVTVLLTLVSPAAADSSVSASKLVACKGEDAQSRDLRVKNISCNKAYDRVVQGEHKQGKGCDQPGTGKTCHSTVAGFKCKRREKPNPDGVGVLLTTTCKKTVRKGGNRIKQTVRYETVFAG